MTKTDTTQWPEPDHRRRLPDTRPSITHEFTVGGQTCKITVGLYKDGTPGEIFIDIQKEGSWLRMHDWVAIGISIGLQYGVPIEVFIDKYRHQNMEPYGATSNPDIPMASSIMDYIVRWIELKFGGEK